MLLIPDMIVCETTRCCASKTLALFVMLRRWQKADTWDDVAQGSSSWPCMVHQDLPENLLPAFLVLQTASPGIGL